MTESEWLACTDPGPMLVQAHRWRHSFSWGRFVVYGNAKSVEEIKCLL